MNTQKLPPIVIFNIIIAAADVILLSRGLMGFRGMTMLLIIIASIILFIVGNIILLSMAFKEPVVRDKHNANAHDFEDAFKGWKGMNTPYDAEIDMALAQIEKLKLRKEKLKNLSKDNTFSSAVEEVETSMFHNFNRIINRLLIYDKSDIADVNLNGSYINKILATNNQYLEVFRRFIDEVAMIGDMSDDRVKTLSLQTITESLREIRTNGDSDID